MGKFGRAYVVEHRGLWFVRRERERRYLSSAGTFGPRYWHSDTTARFATREAAKAEADRLNEGRAVAC